MSFRVRWLAVLGLLVATGCGEGVDLVPVSGRILVDGEPLSNANVIFNPAGPEMPQVNSAAITDSEGNFELKTADNQVGAVVGKHTVMIRPPMIVDLEDNVVPTGLDPDDVDDAADNMYVKPAGDLPESMTARSIDYEVPSEGTSTALISFDSGS